MEKRKLQIVVFQYDDNSIQIIKDEFAANFQENIETKLLPQNNLKTIVVENITIGQSHEKLIEMCNIVNKISHDVDEIREKKYLKELEEEGEKLIGRCVKKGRLKDEDSYNYYRVERYENNHLVGTSIWTYENIPTNIQLNDHIFESNIIQELCYDDDVITVIPESEFVAMLEKAKSMMK